MKHLKRQLELRNLLLSKESLTAREAMSHLDISQATFTRLLSSLEPQILKIGRGRSSRYALKRKINYLPANINSESFNILMVNESAEISHIANLHAISQKSFFVESLSSLVYSKIYSDLPYWLNDCRPSGFLGRLIPKKASELSYPEDIRLWDAECTLAYLSTLGWDLIGNLIIGEKAYSQAINNQENIPDQVINSKRASSYSKLANEIISLGAAGSSAAGEQPKFLAVKVNEKKEKIPVLVKFSPSGEDEISKRRKDLLISEHLAFEVLLEHNVSACKSEIIQGSDRTFLELERFDRIGTRARKGLITLDSLDSEFCGSGGSWKEIALSLKNAKIINENIYEEIIWRYYFGLCIGNNDMHSGNLSFFIQGEKILSLAPVYDMLPMYYAPKYEEIIKPKFKPVILPPNDKNIWIKVLKPAKKFWEQLQKDTRISSDFRDICNDWIEFMNKVSI